MTSKLHPIQTERLVLRPFTSEDVIPSYQMNLDAEVSKYTGDGGIVPLEEIERRIKEDVLGDYKKWGYGRFAVELKDGPSFIGFAGLKYLPDLDEVDLGYRFISDFWGRGLATEASEALLEYGFESLKLKRIIAMVLPENQASVRVLEKLGFEFDSEFIEDDYLVHQYVITA